MLGTESQGCDFAEFTRRPSNSLQELSLLVVCARPENLPTPTRTKVMPLPPSATDRRKRLLSCALLLAFASTVSCSAIRDGITEMRNLLKAPEPTPVPAPTPLDIMVLKRDDCPGIAVISAPQETRLTKGLTGGSVETNSVKLTEATADSIEESFPGYVNSKARTLVSNLLRDTDGQAIPIIQEPSAGCLLLECHVESLDSSAVSGKGRSGLGFGRLDMIRLSQR